MAGALAPGADRRLVWAGSALILAAGALALVATCLLLPMGPVAAGAMGVVAVGVLGVGVLARAGDAARLGVLLLIGASMFGGESGVSPFEALFFVGALAVLVGWYGAVALGGRPLIASGDDAVAALWLGLGVAGALVASAVVGNPVADLRAEAIALFPMFLYFPVKAVVAEHRWGIPLVVGTLAWYGLYSTALNALAVRTAVVEATVWYEVANVRFITGETAMAAALLVGVSLLPALRSRVVRLGLLAVSGTLLIGLVVAKSRGYWLATVFGLGVALVASPPETRRRSVQSLALGGLVLVGLAWALASEQVLLLIEGLVIRFASLSGVGRDPSVLSRVAESAAAWGQIRLNPILGYGWGQQIHYYSALSDGTQHWSFLHNMYAWVWHKVGLWGLGLLLALWARAGVRCARATRSRALPLADRAAAAGTTGAVAALGLVALTSNPLGVGDAALVVTLVLALAHGLGQRAEAAGRAR